MKTYSPPNPPALAFPEAILDRHIATLGITGSGKSFATCGVVEWLLHQKRRVCIIDPKGDFFGLGLDRTGKRPGYDILRFGDFKDPKAQQIALNQHAGKEIANLVATGNRPCMIGFLGWKNTHRTRFYADFMEELFRLNRSRLHLIISEIHNFAPKGSTKQMEGDMADALHWTNRLASEGRGIGIRLMFDSQRPQKVHNDTLTTASTLIAMGMSHPADREAVTDWMAENADSKGEDILASLPRLATGEGWVWCPRLKHLEKTKFPLIHCFDSFAEPEEDASDGPTGWADVDLNEVKAKLSNVVKEAEANDPRALKAKISQLERRIAEPKEETVDHDTMQKDAWFDGYKTGGQAIKPAVRMLLEKHRTQAKALEAEVQKSLTELNEFLESIEGDVPVPGAPIPPLKIGLPQHVSAPRRTNGDTTTATVLSGKKREMMIALAQKSPLTRRQLAARTVMSASGGTFRTYVPQLKTAGYIRDEGGALSVTDEGREALGKYDPLPSGRALLAHWLNELGGKKGELFGVLYESYPKGMTRNELADMCSMEASGGTFRTYIPHLKSLMLVEDRGGMLYAADELFQ